MLLIVCVEEDLGVILVIKLGVSLLLSAGESGVSVQGTRNGFQRSSFQTVPKILR